ncbi:hypothetical protein BHM03_00026411 [Ensete ventricosum]|nr:hypothetical protein BHM03_00026411 [Ensete ventricosum]
MLLGTRQECVRSSSRVSGVCQDGIREFVKRRPRLIGRLSGVAEKLVGSRDGLVMDILNQEAHWEREGRSPERRPEDLPQDCQSLLEYARQRLDRPYHRIRATTNRCRRVNRPDGGWTAHMAVGLPRWRLDRPYHRLRAVAND